MAKINFIFPDGREQQVDSMNDMTVMQLAKYHDIEEILAECGGSCICATCHVYVDESFVDQLPEKTDYEIEVLEETASPAKANSRLSCQLRCADMPDGLQLYLPEQQ